MITQEYLKDAFSYDPETGVFIWKIRPLHHFKNTKGMNIFNSQFAGKIAGSNHTNGYLEVGLSNKGYLLHRLAWVYCHNFLPKDIDHINGIKTDNRLCNLREANRSENNQNQKVARTDNKLGILGIFFIKSRNRFVAQIGLNNKRIHLGYFKTAEEAHQAYLTEKRKIHDFNTL